MLAADIQDEAGRTLAARFPGQVRFAHCDVSDPPQIKAAIELAEVSLWLNAMYPGLKAPWFGVQL